MIISCEKASQLCNKAQYGETSFWQLTLLKWHLYLCTRCAAYTNKNTRLTQLCQKADMKVLSQEDKEAMKDKLRRKIQETKQKNSLTKRKRAVKNKRNKQCCGPATHIKD